MYGEEISTDARSLLYGLLRNVRFEALNRIAWRRQERDRQYSIPYSVPAWVLLDVASDMGADPMVVLNAMHGHCHVYW